MKKILSVILILLIAPTIFLFSSCKKKSNYSMLEFYNSYLAISEESELLTKTHMPTKFQSENKEVVGFVYSSNLANKISTIPAFSYINSLYNTMLDDAMGPTYLYGNMLYNADLDDDTKDYLFNQLKKLKNDYIRIATRLGDLERTQDIATANASLAKLYDSYENAIVTAINLSSKISSIYYNKILENPNVDYTKIEEGKINLNEVAIRTLNRLVYYKLVYVDIYFKTQILGSNVSEKLIEGTFNSYYEPYESLKNKIYSNTINPYIENNREELVELARTLYNIQRVFEKEYNLYKSACNKISYGKIDNKSSSSEKGYKNIIDSFISENGIAYQSYLTVTKILNLCY